MGGGQGRLTKFTQGGGKNLGAREARAIYFCPLLRIFCPSLKEGQKVQKKMLDSTNSIKG